MRWMPVRTFLRGGYLTITEVTVVSKHGHPLFTVFPGVRGEKQQDQPFQRQGKRDMLPPQLGE